MLAQAHSASNQVKSGLLIFAKTTNKGIQIIVSPCLKRSKILIPLLENRQKPILISIIVNSQTQMLGTVVHDSSVRVIAAISISSSEEKCDWKIWFILFVVPCLTVFLIQNMSWLSLKDLLSIPDEFTTEAKRMTKADCKTAEATVKLHC